MAKKSRKLNPVSEAIRLMKEGYSNNYLETYLLEFFNSVTNPEQAVEIITEAESIIEKEHDASIKEVFNLHNVRYRREISRLLAVEELPESGIGKDFTYEEWQASRNRKIKAGLKALDCMKQLENLHLLHRDSTTTIDLNDEFNINMQEKKPAYNLDNLTFDELVEYYEIMMEAKVTDDDKPISVIQANYSPVEEEKYIPIQQEEQANVEQIKQQIEYVPEDNKPVLSPQQKLMENLKRIAAEKFKQIGSKLDNQEQQYLDRS